jgi:hypothetical protein
MAIETKNVNAEILAKAAQAAAEDKAANTSVTTTGEISDKLTIADLRSGALDQAGLKELMALLGVQAEKAAPKRRWDEFKKVYQFPSAPTSFHFSFSTSGKINIPEGIYGTNDEREIKELDAAVEVGNIWAYSPDINYAEFAPTTKIPAPVRTDAIN